ncbi:MAG: patatin-like phospholipase family protein [Pseudomonadota bacterium]
MTKTARARGSRPVSLALQGGGSHGALAWGALGTLLDAGLIIEAVSGTSAGALNAVCLAAGLTSGGPDGGRAALDALWWEVGRAGAFSPYQRSPLARLTGRWDLDDSPTYLWLDGLTRALSPYQTTPPCANILRPILERVLDLESLNASDAPRVFLTATNVRTGLPRVFTQPDISIDAILASAALPQMFRAIEIDGEAYWDGGFVANPALYPLVTGRDEVDLILVQTNPFHRDALPTDARAIQNRLNEVTFNAALLKDLRLLAASGRLDFNAEKGGGVRLHRIGGDEDLAELSPSSKLLAEPAYLDRLRARGDHDAGAFLADHGDAIGYRTSFDPSTMLEGLVPNGSPSNHDIRKTRT